jgi:hypothetical protein
MKQPNGKDLLETLIKLLAEQEGLKIKCEIVGGENEKGN